MPVLWRPGRSRCKCSFRGSPLSPSRGPGHQKTPPVKSTWEYEFLPTSHRTKVALHFPEFLCFAKRSGFPLGKKCSANEKVLGFGVTSKEGMRKLHDFFLNYFLPRLFLFCCSFYLTVGHTNGYYQSDNSISWRAWSRICWCQGISVLLWH